MTATLGVLAQAKGIKPDLIMGIPSIQTGVFGGILAAFDTGIGTGSIATGWLVHAFGFGRAFGVAALLASLALPYFLFAEKRFLSAPRG